MFPLSLTYFRLFVYIDPGLFGLACEFNKLIHCDGRDSGKCHY